MPNDETDESMKGKPEPKEPPIAISLPRYLASWKLDVGAGTWTE